MTSLALKAPTVNTLFVGSIVSIRRGLKRIQVPVVSDDGVGLRVITPDGAEVDTALPSLKQFVCVPSEAIRSYVGRLCNLLNNQEFAAHLSDVSRHRIDEHLQRTLREPAEALGALLDRQPLHLTPEECLALPIESWRVRYELLSDYPVHAAARRELAHAIATDEAAPLGVRIRVCMTHRLRPEIAGREALAVFSSEHLDVTQPEVIRIASTVGAALEQVAFPKGNTIAEAARSPQQFTESASVAAVLAALNGNLPPNVSVEPYAGLPAAVLDDLVDSGIPISPPRFDRTVMARDLPSIPYADYITARVQPTDLTPDAVVTLNFQAEAFRRVVAGDDAVTEVLPPSLIENAIATRALKTGRIPTAQPSDALLQELAEIREAPHQLQASDRLLQDRSVWPQLIEWGVKPGNFESVDGRTYGDLLCLHQARRALFEWEWSAARELAREGLRTAKAEAVRDELLNLVACSLWLQGKPGPALAALDTALDGEYTESLITNAAIVAIELDRDDAISRFVRLAAEAPSPQQRSSAAERALILWANDDGKVWEDGDNEDLPNEIKEALRPLIREALPEDRYVRLLRTLAAHDDNWLAARKDAEFYGGGSTAAARVFRARAKGLDEFVHALATELKAAPPPEWVVAERDSVVQAAIEVLIDRNDEVGAAFFGITVLESMMKLPMDKHISLVCLTVSSIIENIDSSESEPKDKFIDWVIAAKAELTRLDQEEQDRLRWLVDFAGERLAKAYAASRVRQLDEAIELFNRVMVQLAGTPTRRINHSAVGEVMQPIQRFCSETAQLIKRVLPLVDDSDLRKALQSVISTAEELRGRAGSVRR